MTTAAQRKVFRYALRQARQDCGLSQRGLARAVGRTPSAVWQWEEGRGAPDPPTVAKLEQLLGLERDSLARSLGYAAPDCGSGPTVTVADAVNADPRLDESGRRLLMDVYRWIVRDRAARR
jgi:transcriptional regulator with XRE-family HTH domain